MGDPADWLYDPRLTAPEPLSPCLECGTTDRYHLFRCPLHVTAEEEYAQGEEGTPCFICQLPKPHHADSCYRGAYEPRAGRPVPSDFNTPEWRD